MGFPCPRPINTTTSFGKSTLRKALEFKCCGLTSQHTFDKWSCLLNWFNHKVVWEVIIYRLRDFYIRPNMYSRPFTFNPSWVTLIGPKIELYKQNAKQIVKGINTRFDLSITWEILFQNLMLVQWTWNNNMIFKMLFIFNVYNFHTELE